MPNKGYFDTERVNELIAAGSHFWCNACLGAVPLDDQSPDPRYCLGCYEFLLKEAKRLNPGKRSKWIPKKPRRGRGLKPQPLPDASASMDTIKEKTMKPSSTLTNYVHPPKANTGLAKSKRGPKVHELPEDLIRQWASQGKSPQAIAKKLADEHHIFASYKTIKRRLQGVLV